MTNHQQLRDEMIFAAQLIDEVLAYRVVPEEALKSWPRASNSSSEALSKAWTRLRHFADDEDLHRADKTYLSAEQKRLRESGAELLSLAYTIQSERDTL